MAKITPLGNLLRNFKEDDEEEQIKNVYDDGSVWTLPETSEHSVGYQSPIKSLLSNNKVTSGTLEAFNNIADEEVVDPLENPRNQINYYTNQLEGMGQQVEEPKLWQKALGVIEDPLVRISSLASVLPNTIAGFLDASTKVNTNEKANITGSDKYNKVKELGFDIAEQNGIYTLMGNPKAEGYKEAKKLLDETVKENKSSILSKTVGQFKAIASGLSSGFHTATGLVTGEYSDKAIDYGRLLEHNRGDENSNLAGATALVEAPGKYIAKGLGADDETANNWGNLVGDIGLSILSGGLDLNDAGKTIKYLRNTDKLNDIEKVNKTYDALKIAKKYNSYDDYVKSLGDKANKYTPEKLKSMYEKSVNTYAKDLQKDVNKGLGGINNYEGLKFGKKVIVNKEQLTKISKNTTQRRLMEVGLGLYSPVGALLSNPAIDTISKAMDKTESGTALKKDINKLFKGGKNNEWINSMKDNPEKALEYANERKQVGIAKNMSDERVQEVMETINKYSNMKESPEELTRIIEEPTTRKTREVEVEREINNPEYVSKMFSLGKDEIKKQTSSITAMQNKLKAQREDLLETAKKDATQNSSELVTGLDSEINNLQKRLDRINNIQSAKSLDFNKQMKKFGFKDDYTDMFDKAIRTDIDDLTKEVGDRELAEALQESANRVLDNLDKQFPGLSENFSSYMKLDKNEVLAGESLDYLGEELVERAKKSGVKYDPEKLMTNEKYREQLERTIQIRENTLERWSEFSKRSGLDLSDEGDLINSVMDRAYKRRHDVSIDPMRYSKEFREQLDELHELERPRTKLEMELDTPEEIAERKKRIASLKKTLKATEIHSIEFGGDINPYTGEIYNELNSKDTQELQQLTLKLNKDELDKYRKLEKTIKGEEIVGLGYLDKKSASKFAPRLKEELGLKESVAQITKGLMLDGSKYVEKLKAKVYRNSFETVMNLTDDEFDIIKRQLDIKEPIKFTFRQKGNKYSRSVSELDEEAELSKIIAEKRANDANLTTLGQNRDVWIDDMEHERLKAKKPQEYMGDIEDGMAKNKELELEDKYIMQQFKKNKNLHDKLVKQYGNKKGTEIYNNIRKSEAKAEREALDKAIKENKVTREVARMNRIKSAQNGSEEVAVSSDKIVPLTDKKVLGKSVKKFLPDDIKDITGIKLNTANGEIIIDSNIKKSELKNILDNRKYGKAEKGSKIIYTNSKISMNGTVGAYVPESDTVIINLDGLNKTKAQTILEHELGHRVFEKITKKYPDLEKHLLVKPFMDFIKELPDNKKMEFIDVMTIANKGNEATKEMVDIGVVSKYINSVIKNKGKADKVSNEVFAELFSLYNNKNKTIVNKMKNISEEAYESFMFRLDDLPTDEVTNVSKLVRKRFGDDLANQLLELKNKKEAVSKLDAKLGEALKINEVMKKASDVNKTNIEIDNLEKELKELELSMDKHEFDEDGNIISTDYDTFFNKMKEAYPDKVAEIEAKIPRYKKLKEKEDKLFEVIDNTKALSPEAKEYMEEFKKAMKDIAIREGIYEPEEAENFVTYVAHIINPKYSDDAEVIEKGRKLKAELEDPFNVHKQTRKKKGSIKSINDEQENRIGKRVFDENINRLFLARAVHSEDIVTKKSRTERILEQFSIPIVNNFDNYVNSFDHMMEYYGEGLKAKTGLTTKELKYAYRDSGKSSFEFLKDHFFEEFKKEIPDFKNFKNDVEFRNYLKEEGYEGFYVSKMVKAFKDGNTKTIENLMFETRYPMTNKFNYARSLQEKYGYDDFVKKGTDNIPLKTEDGRPYVYEPKKDMEGNKIASKVDRTKEMPYDIEGFVGETTDPIKAYTEFVYKKAKEKNMIIVELPKEKPETIMKRTISDRSMEQAVKDRTTVAERISEMMTGDKEAIEGFDALAGYIVTDPKNIKFEEFTLDSGTKKILIDKNAWENYQKAIKDAEYKDKDALLKVYDYMNNMFKSQVLFNVGFHVRNSIQNVISSYVKTGANLLSPTKNKEALDILRYNAGKLDNVTKEYNGYNVDEILTEAKKSGIFETQYKNEFDKDKTKDFLKGKTDKLETKKYSLGESINPFSTNFVGYRASQKAGDLIEQQAKIVNIITHLESGMDLSDAIHLTKNTLFDYSDLTQFESKVMKRAFPFYTFMRKNIPSQLDNMANSTGRFARMESIYDKSSRQNETDRERALRPEYLDNQLALGNQKYINIGNATDDLKKLINPLEMGSALNPIIKTPIELIFNKQMSTDSDISKYDKPSEKLKYTIESNIPITKQVSALHKLITGTDKEKDKATRTLTKVVGNMVNTYDVEQQEKSTMYDYIEQLQNQYYEYIEKNPNAKAELEAEKQKSTQKGYVSPLKKLLK